MFALAVRYLCGRVTATGPSGFEQPEWPPHPDRLFMALVASHFETEGGSEERSALEWLEQQSCPALHVSSAATRSSVTVFVPVNDVSVPARFGSKGPSDGQVKDAVAVLPDSRPRQPRQFPTVIPEDEVAHFIWTLEIPSSHRDALAALCEKVTYLGHSSTLVQMWLSNEPPAATLAPTKGRSQHRLRITGPGRLAELEVRYGAGLRPSSSLWAGYGLPTVAISSAEPRTVFDENIIVLRRVSGRRLALETTLRLTEALRGAMMSRCPQQPPPEWLSGHKPDSSKSERPHVALIPLPHVGNEHAEGHLLGVALAVPRDINPLDVGRALGPLVGDDERGEPRQTRLVLGDLGEWTVELEGRTDGPMALASRTWVGPARQWSTVTPIVLDRYPKADGEGETIVAAACERIMLPRPRDVVLSAISLHIGVPSANRFPPLPVKFGKSRRYQTHAVLTFDAPVLGPMLLGAGRYRGYGLCRPVRAPRAEQT